MTFSRSGKSTIQNVLKNPEAIYLLIAGIAILGGVAYLKTRKAIDVKSEVLPTPELNPNDGMHIMPGKPSHKATLNFGGVE